ncbi:hypothetical protein BBK82_33800 [Lentzea guizhouensis]|uniref:Photosystem reaction center subunit H n=1 Tax=Lentzea guizhouensis TaxID=1586287 RepID=A0A1B2HRD4_9PSEU|nr:PRC and DUF2382 domain-containing protein [Lentzea guizhouensis]ANZ40268.1 hypothetical protein BBK82_33800 [Lentzea guizhouensis]
MIDRTQLEALYDCDVIDRKGERIGSVKQVWLDDVDGAPTWAEVHTGLFGLKESFVPIQQARVSAGAITVPVDKELVKEAPKIDVDGQQMTDDQQQELYRHYGMIPSAKTGEHDRLPKHGRRDDDSMSVTRSEERMDVGTREVESGRVRLVKHVVTEQRNVTVPVSHEEVRVVREPVEGQAAGSFEDEEASVTLHREEPVVQKRAEAVERVRLEKENVTEQRQVSGEVRKERVDVERDDDSRR